jgi:taurine dioxygenase
VTADFQVEPISGALGARITGIDYRKITDAQFERLQELWYQYLVIFMVDQPVDPHAQRDFAMRFGTVVDHPWDPEKADSLIPQPIAEDCTHIVRVVETGRADAWHADVSYRPSPTIGSVFQYIEGPGAAGGDTMWSNQYLAYETLSEPMRELLLGLTAEHIGKATMVNKRRAVHPVVRVHPVTGRPCLYVNRTNTSYILEMERPESHALLRFLFEHSEQPKFTCRWRWSSGDMVFWDNRCTMHHAVNDYGEQFRLAHRAMIDGDRPEAYRPSRWKPLESPPMHLSTGVAYFMSAAS